MRLITSVARCSYKIMTDKCSPLSPKVSGNLSSQRPIDLGAPKPPCGIWTIYNYIASTRKKPKLGKLRYQNQSSILFCWGSLWKSLRVPWPLGVLQESLELLGIPGWFLGRPLGRPWTFLGVLRGTVRAEFQHLGATAAKVLAILMLFGTLARSCNEFQRQRGSMGQKHW